MQRTFVLGKPSHLADVNASVYPILLARPSETAPLVMFPRATELVQAEDTGNINGVKLVNNGPQPIFVRAGTLFEGVGTQSRTNIEDVVLVPGQPVTVKSRCVHLTHGISPGATFRSTGETTPLEVERSLAKGQHETWEGVNEYVKKAGAARGRSISRAQDELITAKKGAWSDDDRAAHLLAKISRTPGQVGVLTLVGGAVVGLEAFADTASWDAYATDVLRKHVDAILTREGDPAREVAEASLRLVNELVEGGGDGAMAEGVTIAQHEGEIVRVAKYV